MSFWWILIFPTSRLPPRWAICRWGILISRYINIAHLGYNTILEHVWRHHAFRTVQTQSLIFFWGGPVEHFQKMLPCQSLPALCKIVSKLLRLIHGFSRDVTSISIGPEFNHCLVSQSLCALGEFCQTKSNWSSTKISKLVETSALN